MNIPMIVGLALFAVWAALAVLFVTLLMSGVHL